MKIDLATWMKRILRWGTTVVLSGLTGQRAHLALLAYGILADSNKLLNNVLIVIAEATLADTRKYQLTSQNSSASGFTLSAMHKNIKNKAVNDFCCSMGAAMHSMLHVAYITVRTMEDQANNRYKEKIQLTENISLKKSFTPSALGGKRITWWRSRGH
jgi:hypothetical protein